MTWILSQLRIQGVKGVLDRAGDFTLQKKNLPRSIALFGRNAHGKSGYADAIEYLFSLDGEVEHLGKGSADSELGGKHALPHVLAIEKGIVPQVYAEFTNLESGKKVIVTRQVNTGRNDIRPIVLDAVLEIAPAYRILRQHDLRRFVVDMTPGQKFEEFARWIGLKSATTVLKHLTTVEGTLEDTDVDREIAERLKSIDTHTLGAIQVYDLKGILDWCGSEVTKYLGQPYTIAKTEEIDNGLATLRAKRDAAANQAQMARASLAKAAIDMRRDDGTIQNLRASVKKALVAEQKRDAAQAQASESVFQEVWEASQRLLEVKKVEKCPTCQTPWEKTDAGSQEKSVVALRNSLGTLTDLKKQDTMLQQEILTVKNRLQQLEAGLTEISNYAQEIPLPEIQNLVKQLGAQVASQQQSLESIKRYHKDIELLLSACQGLANKSIPNALENLSKEASSSPTSDIDVSISHLQGLHEAIERLAILSELQNSIRNAEQEFKKIADRIRAEIKKVADNAIDALRDDARSIYRKIHPGEAVPNVFIRLNTEEKTLTIRVNFHSNERIVPPGGYLSEAQINTLGLALFLSSVRLFNRDFPFVFLDDIVSSYDADNRARIVDILAEDMSDFQIFLTTHDERFYTHLKGRLEEGGGWEFERISGYDFESGPRRESDNLRPTQIDVLIKQSDEKIAGNAVRQFMEDWFDKTCETFWVLTPHKRGIREFKRTLFDFWPPFIKRLESSKGTFGTRILSSPVYERLGGGLMPIVNYYSHNQSNPYEWASMGDVEYIWHVFQDFMALFRCASCKKMLSYNIEDARFYCTCGGAILAPQKPAEA